MTTIDLHLKFVVARQFHVECSFFKAAHQVKVTFVPPGVEQIVGHGLFHRTLRFVGMGAVGKSAL